MEDDLSASSCSAFRQSSSSGNYIEIKNGTPYKVTTGYRVYGTEATLGTGPVKWSKAGAMIEMTFESAAALAAGAALLTTALAF